MNFNSVKMYSATRKYFEQWQIFFSFGFTPRFEMKR